MRDSLRGPKAIKDAGEKYLPRPSGFVEAQAPVYDAYLERADFPHILPMTLSGMVGLIHKTEFDIQGLEAADDKTGTAAKPLADMWERATKEGLPLEAFSRRVTAELLLMGRYVILPDLPTEEEGGGDLPWLAGYAAETLLNWDDDREMFVLDETDLRRSEGDEFTWETFQKWRVLRLEDGKYTQQVYDQDNKIDGNEKIEPKAIGGKTLDKIPLVVAGPRDLVLTPEDPPLIGVARACKRAYQIDADYRLQLFMSGQETLVVSGASEAEMPTVVGAMVAIRFQDPNAKASYVGPSGKSIEQQAKGVADSKEDALMAGAQLFAQTEAPSESGVAKELRFTAQTATLGTVAMASAAALEAALRQCAIFVGQDPEEIIVTANPDIVTAGLTPQEAVQLMQVWQSGGISYETFYENLQRGRIASAERTAEEEQDLVDEETPDVPLPGADLTAGAPPGDTGTDITSDITDQNVADLFDSNTVAGP